MTELTAKEKDLLQRVHEKPELRALFFRKVKGLKWFDALQTKGYFSPQEIPPPKSKKDGYITVPSWPVLNYLVETASELSDDREGYIIKFVNIICEATNYAKAQGFGNYHVWWQFSEIISQIPNEYLTADHLEVVDYWLDDKYERGLVATEVGGKWLPSLLEDGGEHASELAVSLLKILYQLVFVEQNREGKKRVQIRLRFKDYSFRITKKIAPLAGSVLGQDCLTVFDAKLKEVLEKLENDQWSCIWQPAIEDHDQNKYRDDAENILILAYRDSLQAYINQHPDDSLTYISTMFEGGFQTISRIAINAIGQNPEICRELFDMLLDSAFFTSNYRHEIWHFLSRNYSRLDNSQKQKILDIISGLQRKDDDGEILEGATAYRQASWLSAIKSHGEKESALYKDVVKTAQTEPDHPDFSSYMSTGWVEEESPFAIEELSALSTDNLVETLAGYQDKGGYREPGIEGLVKTVKQLIKANPLQYHKSLVDFSDLDLAYIYPVIEAFSELWKEKAKLPWDEVWQFLLEFCFTVVKKERFWNPENERQRNHFIANRSWIVGAIGRLVEAGIKSDKHAFNEKYHADAEKLIVFLLDKEKGEEFEKNSNDAVSISINSSRGRCIEALINLTLRMCRLSDKENKGHDTVWEHFQPHYDKELDRADIPEYEFATLVTNYLPNFLYMSKDWVLGNLNRVFDQEHYTKWSCAMQGYSYVSSVYQKIYIYLRDHGDFIKVLDDENLSDDVEDKVIEHIVVAFIHDFEKLADENSLISMLIERGDSHELNHLVWFIWTLRKKDDLKLRDKVYLLWPIILDAIDLLTQEGKQLASNLCHWAAFVDRIDEKRKHLLLSIASYADESHNSYELLQSLSRISTNQPFEANDIWKKMLKGTTPDYPEESVREILSNLVLQGPEGIRTAQATVSEYIKVGNENPSLWLQKIIQEQNAED